MRGFNDKPNMWPLPNSHNVNKHCGEYSSLFLWLSDFFLTSLSMMIFFNVRLSAAVSLDEDKIMFQG